VSMMIITLMRVLLDHAIFEEPAMATRRSGDWGLRTAAKGDSGSFAATSDECHGRRRAEATLFEDAAVAML
jgi:hypothetical protein